MRSMDYIGISQTIGRVIRKGNTDKVYGLVCVPVYSNVGISTARKVEAVVDTIFNKGCLLYTSPSPRDRVRSRMPSSA